MIYQRLAGLAFAVLFAAYGYFALSIQLDFWATEEVFNAQTFPLAIAVGGTLVSLLFTLFPGAVHRESNNLPAIQARSALSVLGLLILMLAYSALLELIGFIAASVTLLAGGFWILGERRGWRIAVISIAVAAGFYGLMGALGIYLEPGILALGMGAND